MIREHKRGVVRVIEMNDGKANFLSLELRKDLLASLRRCRSDASLSASSRSPGEPPLEAVVLAGRGRCFCAGMNLDELDGGSALQSPSLHGEILDELIAMPIPVIAAVHGGAHGGGLELALGCHYRVATNGTELSLPELLVGLIPGARGTQHLPRVIGLEAAASMILTGRRVKAEDAPLGLIDLTTDDDVVTAAIDFAESTAIRRPVQSIRDKPVNETACDLRSFLVPETADLPGVQAAISLLLASTFVPYSETVQQEFSQFTRLAKSPSSRPYREAFRLKLKAEAQAKRLALASSPGPYANQIQKESP